MKSRKLILITAVTCLIVFASFSYAFELPKWFPFSQQGALNEWQEKIFKGRVLYAVQSSREGGYLSAKSDKTCSGLFHKINFHPRKFPMMSWQWKVVQFPQESQIAKKEGSWVERDDFAARVYVIFPSWNFMAIQSLEYIWSENIKEGTVITNPSFKNLKLMVVESGRSKAGQWVLEERNIYEDYTRAFGYPPRKAVGAIALMTDSDNTISTAEALYKDIKVGYEK